MLLVSLKAAALGVNLTVANHVVLMDLWWNPTVEEQVCVCGRTHGHYEEVWIVVCRPGVTRSFDLRLIILSSLCSL